MDVIGVGLEEIAWSNLAKVAPAEGGNPSGSLLELQHPHAGQLLRREVTELDPEMVLIISGRGYTDPFLRGGSIPISWSPRAALQFAGTIEGRRWIVVNHPGTFADRFERSWQALDLALRA